MITAATRTTGVPSLRVGYLVPEFPGQTHGMFWTELAALRRLGVDVQTVSTRESLACAHAWSEHARRTTAYLYPPTPRALGHATKRFIVAGPTAWSRLLREVLRSERTGRSRLRLLALALLGAELAHLARARQWQHVHVHSCAEAADIVRLARHLGGPTYSMTLHGPLSDYGPDQRSKWAGAAFAVVITQQLHDEVARVLCGALPDRVRVAGMGVDPTDYDRGGYYEPWSGEGPARIFSCGRLNPAKGHADLLTAVSLLRRQGVDARLVIAGEDEQQGRGYRRVLERRVQELGLADTVELLGAVGEDVVRRQLASAHVFALASNAEPLGVAIMEALASGVPVVATAAGGVPELVRDGEDGLLVDPGRPVDLARVLAEVLGDAALAQRLASAGPRRMAARAVSGSSAQTLHALLTGLESRADG